MTLNTLTIPPYLEAAQHISDELELRGFTTDDPSKSEGLIESIAQIIKKTMEGNLVVGGDDWMQRFFDDAGIQGCPKEIEDELGRLPGTNDGWDNDLQNQIT